MSFPTAMALPSVWGATKSRSPFEANVEIRHFVWSATTCDFPGAGVYLGLAPYSEHVAVARWLTSRQLRVFTGGRIRVSTDGLSWNLNYYAVRDPSAVKVKPLDKPPLPNGFRHVKLAFQFDRAATPPEDSAASKVSSEGGSLLSEPRSPELTTAAFVLTIGLPMAREDQFFELAIGNHPDQDWGDVYGRMLEMGCKDTL